MFNNKRGIFNYLLLITCVIYGCSGNNYNAPTTSEDGFIQMVVEIPAGTNKKFEFNPTTGEFELDTINGKGRIIQFLPYPGNYGFIPSTLMDTARGGDGDALDILVVSETLPQATLLEVIPVGVLHLIDRGEQDDKIIAVPAAENLRIIECEDFACLDKQYPNALAIIEKWFTSYKGVGKMKTNGWGDEKEAMRIIDKWKKND